MQAYNSNYSHEILETIDRISSLKAFRLYVDEEKHENIRQQSKQLALEYTPDGKQFFDQGKLFQELKLPNKDTLALMSFILAVELDSNEYFTPSCYLEMGKIYLKQNDASRAKLYLKLASQIFAFFDQIEEFKECETLMAKIK
jgi:3'-phosphoadenosine 5'-phosphosulfate sulfotransferase